MKNQTESTGFAIEKILKAVLDKSKNVSDAERNQVIDQLSEEIRNKPFKVAVIGQSGVGKTSTIQAVFGVKPSTSNEVRSIIEGTRVVETKVYEIMDGFSLSLTDMPGLKNDITKDKEIYIPLYEKTLPQCDLIIYIIDASAKELGIDIQILRDTVIPICKKVNKTKNIIIALNKIDVIGQSFPEYKTDKEYHWDKIENKPTGTLSKLIEERLMQIYRQLVKNGIFDDIDTKQSPGYSAVYAYNMQGFLEAILKSERGWIFVGTVADKVMAKWSEKRQK